MSSPCWEITYSVNILFHKGKKYQPVSFFLAYPFDLPLRQNLISLECSSSFKEATDEHGNPWLSIPIKEGERKFSFTYKALIKPCRLSYSWDAFEESLPLAPRRFLMEEPGIESCSPEVLFLANQIKGKPLEIVQKAFSLVRNTLKYQLQKQEYGAKYAAITGKGDCTEYASLFAAILRACNIGARINVGFLEGNQLHAITEVFLGGMWIPMDITNDQKPFLGNYRDFITLMRANWMLSKGMEKIVSFYYKSDHKMPPSLNSSIEVKKVTPKMPFPKQPERECKLLFFMVQQDDLWQIHLENPTSLRVSASLILQSSNKVLKVWSFTLASQEKSFFTLACSLLKSYFFQYNTLKLLIKQGEKVFHLSCLTQDSIKEYEFLRPGIFAER